MSAHLMTFAGHGTFSPDGKVDITPEQATIENQETDRAELAQWMTAPDRFAPAYYSFPAESETLFGRPRSYRATFAPALHTYINQETVSAPGTAKHAIVSTWNGTVLGRIISAHVYRHNFGGRFVSLTVHGTNGATYTGRASWDNGQIIRLRKVKS